MFFVCSCVNNCCGCLCIGSICLMWFRCGSVCVFFIWCLVVWFVRCLVICVGLNNWMIVILLLSWIIFLLLDVCVWFSSVC